MSERSRKIARLALEAFTILLALGAIALVVAPIFIRTDTYGIHDWDQMESNRYLAVKTIKRFHQVPFWDPYSCGGHTWWGGLETGTIFVSPMLPLYLLTPFTWALRLEVVLAAFLGALGTWLFAGRFTKSPGLKLIAVAAFALDGRFGLQASVGHTWHLYYAWTPWALFFLDRAIGMAPHARPLESPRKFPIGSVTLLGTTLAMMVYTGGIYPLPQTVVIVALYAISCAIASRSWRPIACAIAGGALSFAFAAPRLLPLLDMLRRYPRLVDSTEVLDLSGLIGVFTAKEADHHPPISQWGWHEYGIYTGWIPVLIMLGALFFAVRARERALRLAGAMCLLMGMGRFHDYAPWPLMHDHLPIFESQHVPSRWLYPGTLVLVVCGVACIERILARQRRRGLLDLGLMFVGAYVALDVGLEAQKPFVGSFVRRLGPLTDSVGEFHQELVAPPALRYDVADWAPPNMPAMIVNEGIIDCANFPGYNTNFRDKQNHAPGLGAVARGDPRYRGEVYTDANVGTVNVDSWTPNAVTVSVHGARPGDLLVLNQNWDAGWRANGSAAIDRDDVVATRIRDADETVTFRYIPRFFFVGCLLCISTIAGLVWLSRARRVVLERNEA